MSSEVKALGHDQVIYVLATYLVISWPYVEHIIICHILYSSNIAWGGGVGVYVGVCGVRANLHF